MLRRIEPEESALALRLPVGAAEADPIVAAVAESELETTPLPQDHPRWLKDAVTISQRARDAIARLKPVVVRVMSIWDHRFRRIAVGGRHVTVDPSGSYRIDF
jgi:hypothetical protein